jgi:hypothetical protein
MSLIPSSKADAKRLEVSGHTGLLFPLDEVLQLDRLPFKMTVAVMLEIAREACRSHSYEEAEQKLRERTCIRLNDDSIRAVTNTVGELVFANDVRVADEKWALLDSAKLSIPDKKLNYILYLEVDGAMLPTRHKNDQGSIWKENKLGMAFSTDNFLVWTDGKGQKRHRILKREYTAFVEGLDGFKKQMLALALRNGYGQYRQTVLLSDGATWIRKMKDELFPDAQQILDFFHLCENVSNFSKSVFSMDEAKYRPWTDMMCDLLKASCLEKAIGEIKKLGKRLLSKSKHDLLQYLMHNKDNIDYATYIGNGYFIGSGAIESGNRTVLQQRLKQPGMRWNTKTGQYILTLMAKDKSGLWEQDVVQAIYRHYGIDPNAGFIKAPFSN